MSGSEKLTQSERLRSEKRIDALFREGRWGRVEPLRYCWSVREANVCAVRNGREVHGAGAAEAGTQGEQGAAVQEDAAVSVLFSVPKKSFKRAWKRNLLKRRLRESYRRRKYALTEAIAATGRRIDIALICAPTVEKGTKNPNTAKNYKKVAAARIEIPDFKTIDNAVAKILEQIHERVAK